MTHRYAMFVQTIATTQEVTQFETLELDDVSIWGFSTTLLLASLIP